MGRARGSHGQVGGSISVSRRWRAALERRDLDSLSAFLSRAGKDARPLAREVASALLSDVRQRNSAGEAAALDFLRLADISAALDAAAASTTEALSKTLLAVAHNPTAWPEAASARWAWAFCDAVAREMMRRGAEHWERVVFPYLLRDAVGRFRVRPADRVVTTDDWRALLLERYPCFADWTSDELVVALNSLVLERSRVVPKRDRPGGGGSNADLIIRSGAALASQRY